MGGRIETRSSGGIFWVIFDNPDKRNAMSLDMWSALESAVAAASADPTIRVLALRGAGTVSFVAGSDISSFGESRSAPATVRTYNATVERGLAALAGFPKPAIAAISGYCIGGGISIAAACDLRFASSSASFAIPAGRLGVGYSRQQIARLQQIVGPALVRDMIFTSRRLKCDEAMRRNLVDAGVDDAEFEAFVAGRLEDIAGNAPLTLAAAKRASQEALLSANERNNAELDTIIEACFASEDYREGQAAFAAKRKPVFKGG